MRRSQRDEIGYALLPECEAAFAWSDFALESGVTVDFEKSICPQICFSRDVILHILTES